MEFSKYCIQSRLEYQKDLSRLYKPNDVKLIAILKDISELTLALMYLNKEVDSIPYYPDLAIRCVAKQLNWLRLAPDVYKDAIKEVNDCIKLLEDGFKGVPD